MDNSNSGVCMKRIAVTVSDKTAAELDELVRLLNGHHGSTDQYCSHGLLTRSRLLAMLAEDAGLVISRPGSWEGSNMAQVLSSHGYEV
ncbi:hypothetical protein GTH10_14920 [Burkholderia thailandensis]|uniref:hypothetical protein n=2 Tax=Burkholderia TaxID=32008 RepID=UPI00148EA813|nr:hypothetical protein [Burkholderia thailandensis]NOK48641.1 hypothetical protein [Burkholderia thailandensis]